jgi:Flp pilus assembly protein CpaB
MRFFLMTAVLVIAIIGGVIGTMYLFSKKPLPPPVVVVKEEPTTKPGPKVLGPNEVRVLIAARPIAAYKGIGIEDISVNGQLTTQDLDRKAIAPGVVVMEGTLDKLKLAVGRVARRDIPAGKPLFDSDFFHADTREGVVAAIPAGKRAMIIDAARLPGVHNLRAGDRIDLVAAIPVNLKDVNAVVNGDHTTWNNHNNNFVGPGVVATAARNWTNPDNISSPIREAEVRVLVDNGVIVMPAHKATPGAPLAPDRSGGSPLGGSRGTSGSLDGLTGPPPAPKGGAAKTGVPVTPVDEVMIVMSPDEVPLLTQAMAIGAQIIVIPRSGSPETEAQSQTIQIKPKAEKKEGDRVIVEEVVGQKRNSIVIPMGKEN